MRGRRIFKNTIGFCWWTWSVEFEGGSMVHCPQSMVHGPRLDRGKEERNWRTKQENGIIFGVGTLSNLLWIWS
jgi:hypothetical protein